MPREMWTTRPQVVAATRPCSEVARSGSRCGAASGIGRATALRLAVEGAELYLTDRNAEGLAATVAAAAMDPPAPRKIFSRGGSAWVASNSMYSVGSSEGASYGGVKGAMPVGAGSRAPPARAGSATWISTLPRWFSHRASTINLIASC